MCSDQSDKKQNMSGATRPAAIGGAFPGQGGPGIHFPFRTYMVGGAVRDHCLGLPVHDRDWVVVGATPADMQAHGFVPVGKDFPVFLHPQTHEEYALARTERKSGHGYKGFTVHASPDVTLEEDLARRDLTINAMAVEMTEDGSWHLHDPYGGQQDLQQGVLRHVSDAFREDPVRILRLARFCARFVNFSIAPHTFALMREMVAAGEVAHLVPERVWQELARGLMEARPSRMLEVLRTCKALEVLLPELDRLWGIPLSSHACWQMDTGAHVLMAVDAAAQSQAPLEVRYACLLHALGKGTTLPQARYEHCGQEEKCARHLAQQIGVRLRVPLDARELAEVVVQEHGKIHRSMQMDVDQLMQLLERTDALRRPQRFQQALWACECDARGYIGAENAAYPQRDFLESVLAAAQAVPTARIARAAAQAGLKGPQVGEKIRQARIEAVQHMLQNPLP